MGWVHHGFGQQIIVGGGEALGSLRDLPRITGARRLLLVTTPNRLADEASIPVVRALGRNLAATFDRVEAHVPTPSIQAAISLARAENIDGVVSLGGGSAVDTAKAVAWFLEKEAGTPGTHVLDRPAVPHLAVPTTLAGAAFTGEFAMTDPRSGAKDLAGGPTAVPRGVIVNRDAVAAVDRGFLLLTGFTALAHALETSWSTQRTPEAGALAAAASGRLLAALSAAVDSDPIDAVIIEELVDGAVLAGRARQNAVVALHHELVRVAGGRSGMADGLLHALLLPHTLRFNDLAIEETAGRLAEQVVDGLDLSTIVADLASAARATGGLSDHGFDDDMLEAVVRTVASSPAVERNPMPVGEGDIRGILESAWV
ncbi:MAG: maleylacetate reductase [Actinomycetia bacterium]|nr:maleylacetate reductase [Actinomycetes bacterium]MCP4086185.1 maleylacetate reductase [Actinomycetes bacterium]